MRSTSRRSQSASRISRSSSTIAITGERANGLHLHAVTPLATPCCRAILASGVPYHGLGSLFAGFGRQHLPGPDQCAQGAGLHLPHDVAAMQLHRDLAYAEIEGDLLVEAPTRHLAQHLALARRERGQQLEMAADSFS